MNVVITGATGFIGSYLCRKIIENGGRVLAIVRKQSMSSPRLFHHPNMHIVEGNLHDIEAWEKKIKETGLSFDAFYHLAWEGVGNKERNSHNQIKNIEYSIQTLRLAKKINCSKWVSTGSQAEYGPLNKKISEIDAPSPTTIYGASKLAVYNLAAIIGRQLDIDVVWARVFSTYGPGDNAGWMLIDVIDNIIQKKRPVLTLGEQIWDYLYVEDAAEALMNLAISEQASGLYNLGYGQAATIRSYVETIRDLIDPKFELKFGEMPYRPDQVMHLEADIGKLIRDTGWRPSVDFKTGIHNTIENLRRTRKGGE